ncbi:hypothetical protein D3C71_18570 [compost metagenome]
MKQVLKAVLVAVALTLAAGCAKANIDHDLYAPRTEAEMKDELEFEMLELQRRIDDNDCSNMDILPQYMLQFIRACGVPAKS